MLPGSSEYDKAQARLVLESLNADPKQLKKDAKKADKERLASKSAVSTPLTARAPMPLGIPGIASLFTMNRAVSATDLNKKICESLVNMKVGVCRVLFTSGFCMCMV